MSLFGMRATLRAGMAALTAGLALCGGALAADPTPEQKARLDSVVAVEAAFAKRAVEIGNVPAFREFAAPGVVMFLPEPIVATDYLATADWPGLIEWRADFVAVSKAGDLAFASGPSQWTVKGEVDPGYYITVWAKQPDGSWMFALDRATPGTPNLYVEPAVGPRVYIPGPDEASQATAAGLEAVLADGLSRDAGGTIAARLHPGGRVIRAGHAPAATPEARRALLKADPARVETRWLGGSMSKSGDFAYSWGETRWAEGDKPRRGHYVRLWVLSGKTWSILVDHQIALPAKD